MDISAWGPPRWTQQGRSPRERLGPGLVANGLRQGSGLAAISLRRRSVPPGFGGLARSRKPWYSTFDPAVFVIAESGFEPTPK
jgi:hypothetical protein